MTSTIRLFVRVINGVVSGVVIMMSFVDNSRKYVCLLSMLCVRWWFPNEGLGVDKLTLTLLPG